MERSAAAEVTGSLHGFPAALTSFIGRADVVKVSIEDLDYLSPGASVPLGSLVVLSNAWLSCVPFGPPVAAT